MSKYLSYDERLTISLRLKEGLSFKAIGEEIGKDRTTVAKEVKKHVIDRNSGCSGFAFNDCKHRSTCRAKQVCGEACVRKTKRCSLCGKCIPFCKDYIQEVCRTRFSSPYACNGCKQLETCTLLKSWYDPVAAQTLAEKQISESRTGILANEAELARINSIVTTYTKQGQSLHSIYVDHSDELMCSEKTLYNYVDGCLLDVRNIDLPRKVRYRQRKKEKTFKVDRACRNGREYENFESYLDKNPDTQVVQMDSVMGDKSGKCLLTIHFIEASFMIAFIRDGNTASSVTQIFKRIFNILGRNEFEKLFPVILTDNGSEFSDPESIELGPDKTDLRRTSIFYCDPSKPYQKGAIEVNHELIRRVLPKGTSFDSLTQEDVNKMMSHINSYKRKKLNNRTPYEMFSFLYGEGLAEKLGISGIAPEEVTLKPYLLK